MQLEYRLGNENRHTIWMDDVDLVVNPHYKSVESSWLRYDLEAAGITANTYYQIDGDISNDGQGQYVVIEVDRKYNDEVIVKLKLFFEEYPTQFYEVDIPL